jgi:hypothetical protein
MPRLKISCSENDTAYFKNFLITFDKNSLYKIEKLVELCMYVLVCVFMHEWTQVCVQALSHLYQMQQNFE